MARQSQVEDAAGTYEGARKYGPAANMPKGAKGTRAGITTGGVRKQRDPSEGHPRGGPGASAPEQPVSERVRKPTLDEMTVGRTEVPLGHERPARRIEIGEDGSQKKKAGRRGRPKKTGRPGA